MWLLHQKATRFHRPPSELVGLTDEWAAYQLDNAVNFFGITLENALAERDKVGTGANVEYRERYSLSQLLEPDFRLPRPQARASRKNRWAAFAQSLMAYAGKPNSGVRAWKYVGPDAAQAPRGFPKPQ